MILGIRNLKETVYRKSIYMKHSVVSKALHLYCSVFGGFYFNLVQSICNFYKTLIVNYFEKISGSNIVYENNFYNLYLYNSKWWIKYEVHPNRLQTTVLLDFRAIKRQNKTKQIMLTLRLTSYTGWSVVKYHVMKGGQKFILLTPVMFFRMTCI